MTHIPPEHYSPQQALEKGPTFRAIQILPLSPDMGTMHHPPVQANFSLKVSATHKWNLFF